FLIRKFRKNNELDKLACLINLNKKDVKIYNSNDSIIKNHKYENYIDLINDDKNVVKNNNKILYSINKKLPLSSDNCSKYYLIKLFNEANTKSRYKYSEFMYEIL